MKKSAPIAIVLLLSLSCADRKSLTQQLTATFASHLGKLDSAATLDSIHLLWTIPVTEKLGRIVDDTVYMREYARIKMQLTGAQQHGDKDSVAFLQYEIAVMERGIDSMSKAIGNGDTTHAFGSLMGCLYYLRKSQESRIDSTMLFADSTRTLRYTEFLDSSLARTLRRMK